jgi:methyl-accepting chemotaxis protein
MNTPDATSGSVPLRHKRRLRNYLLDAGLQVRYTAFIIAVAVFLTAVLGAKIYEATRATSQVIMMTGLVDPAVTTELQAQFQANDRVVLFGIVGFGILLVLSIFGAGIWITHKVAGPLFSISVICGRVRDNKLSPSLRQLRRGDELQEFYSSFREMYEALRTRVAADVQTLGNAITALEASGPKSPQVQEAVSELREMRRQKEQSLEPGAG